MKQACLHFTHRKQFSRPDDQQTWKHKRYNAAVLSKTCGKCSHRKRNSSKTLSVYPMCIFNISKRSEEKALGLFLLLFRRGNASSPQKVFIAIESPRSSGKGLDTMNFWNTIFFFNITTLTSHKSKACRHMRSKTEVQKEL